MQIDFHYYATYCAAYMAGYSHDESMIIATSAQLTDECSVTMLNKIHGPKAAATTQLQLELMDTKLDFLSLQDITRIWASFHFLPYDLYATFPKRRNKAYMDKYRLICKPNSKLLVETVELAKEKDLQAVGLAMHVLADTWAHSYFAGVPSLVINNTNFQFYEIKDDKEVPVSFIHNPKTPDNLEISRYTNSLYQGTEFSVMNLGHGRAGHLPDYSFIRYKYLPAWGDYSEIIKDNPSEYMKAFGQMIHAMKYLRGEYESFSTEYYEDECIEPWKEDIRAILTKRQLLSSEDWKAFGKKLSGYDIPDFEITEYEKEYITAKKEEKNNTFLGRFIMAALAQKSMVTNRIFKSGNLLAGFSIDFNPKKLRGIKDFFRLVETKRGDAHE